MILFTEMLTRAIKDSKHTPHEVAELCGVSIYTLRAWVDGIQVPQRQYVMRLADTLYPTACNQGYNIMLNTISMEQVGEQ
jgi:pyrroloquinoline quinone (PQQ) biosynthesis protein C